MDVQRSTYYAKISGPLLDRLDIQAEVTVVKFQDIARPRALSRFRIQVAW